MSSLSYSCVPEVVAKSNASCHASLTTLFQCHRSDIVHAAIRVFVDFFFFILVAFLSFIVLLV